MLVLDRFNFMSPPTTHIYQHDRPITSFETSTNSFLEREEIQPIRTTIALASHPKVKVIEKLRVFGKPVKQVLSRVEPFLERAVVRISGVLVLTFGEEGRKGHSGDSDNVVGMIDARFKPRNDQIFGDIVWDVSIDPRLTNGAYSDEVSKEAQK